MHEKHYNDSFDLMILARLSNMRSVRKFQYKKRKCQSGSSRRTFGWQVCFDVLAVGSFYGNSGSIQCTKQWGLYFLVIDCA